MDTKSEELLFLASQLKRSLTSLTTAEPPFSISIIDVSASPSSAAPVTSTTFPTISVSDVLASNPGAAAKSAASLAADRGEAVQAVSDALKRFVRGKWDTGALAGAAGIGGSGGTAIIAPALRGLPVGVPKIIVSTVARCVAITRCDCSESLMPSVVDLAHPSEPPSLNPRFITLSHTHPIPTYHKTQRQHGAIRGHIGAAAAAIGGGRGGAQRHSPSNPIASPPLPKHHPTSGNTAPYVGTSDLLLLPSVADVAGLNAILRAALSSAAAALAGMLLLRALPTQPPSTALPSSVGASAAATAPVTVGITMFGVTTPCVTEVQRLLSSKASKEGGAGWVGDAGGVGEVETVVFHATGTGGRAMEENVASGLIQVRSLHIPLFTRPLIPPHHAAHPLTALLTSTRAASYQHSEIRIDLPRSFHSKLTLPSPLYQPVLHITTTEVKDLVVGGTMACLQFTVLTVTSATPLPPHPVLDVTTTEAADFVAVLDITTTEVADFIVGGTMPCLPTRFDAAIQHKVPLVLSLGALDMVNFGEASSVPKEFDGRTLHVHNPQVTLMRTTADENRRIAQFIADKMNQSQAPVTLLIPEGGLSALDAPGMAFWDPAADAALFDELEKQVEQTDSRKVIKSVPVLAGVCATDPFRQMPLFLRRLAALGFAGVQNFPTVGLYDGSFRTNLEETNMGYPLEVAMIKTASLLGFLTTPYAFNEEEARSMAGAGADVVVAHMGLTAAGSIGARTVCSLEEAVGRVQRMADAARGVNPNVLVLCHGGPISGPEEARYVLQNTRRAHSFYGASSMEARPSSISTLLLLPLPIPVCTPPGPISGPQEARYILQNTRGVHGFYGASSMERLPVETAITENLKAYKAIRLSS
ncbi:unnamed protein product [Closterium sp. Naga37s-1]|nr:unnamed protein product [Closterium sp. Naga37s-1]